MVILPGWAVSQGAVGALLLSWAWSWRAAGMLARSSCWYLCWRGTAARVRAARWRAWCDHCAIHAGAPDPPAGGAPDPPPDRAGLPPEAWRRRWFIMLDQTCSPGATARSGMA